VFGDKVAIWTGLFIVGAFEFKGAVANVKPVCQHLLQLAAALIPNAIRNAYMAEMILVLSKAQFL